MASTTDTHTWFWDDNCDVVIVEGVDAQRFLQGQVSADVTLLEPGDATMSMLLEPSGRPVAWGRLWCTDVDVYMLEVEQGFATATAARLERFLIRTKATVRTETWHRRRYRDIGSTIGWIDSLFGSIPDSARSLRIVAAEANWPGGAIDVVTEANFQKFGDALEIGTSAPHQQFELARIWAGVPRLGAEVTSDVIPAAAGIVADSTSFTKGCYVGQEFVARIDSRGSNTPERLRRFSSIDTGTAPAPGSVVSVGSDEVGRITSSARVADGRWVALGYLHRGVQVPSVVRTSAGEADAEEI